MNILGIDPGLANCGYAVISPREEDSVFIAESGCITTDKGTPEPDRVYEMFDAVYDLIKKYKPNTVIVEDVFFSNNVSSAMKTAKCIAAVELAIAFWNESLEEPMVGLVTLSPTEIKKVVTGNGRASKEEIGLAVAGLSGVVFNNDHSADAAAAVFAFLGRRNVSV